MGIFDTSYPVNPNNYTQAHRPYSNSVNKIVIHVTQGSWSGAINWFENPNSGVSAHYFVRSSDSFIGKAVLRKNIACHAGNWGYNQTSRDRAGLGQVHELHLVLHQHHVEHS
jgi:N-acetyl-anhydromuramyl-L-alanine amidase AmpD